MLMDAASGLQALAQQLEGFAASSAVCVSYAAEVSADKGRHDELLLGLRVNKGTGQQLTISDDRWLELNASPENIQSFAALLREPRDGDHRHLYSSPIALIVEEGEPWIEA